MPDIVACPAPGCEAPAFVYQRWPGPSDGPVEHAMTGCEAGHRFTTTAAPLRPFRMPNSVTVIQEATVR